MSKREDFIKTGLKEIYRGLLHNAPQKEGKVIAKGDATNVEFNKKYGYTNENPPKNNKGNDGR